MTSTPLPAVLGLCASGSTAYASQIGSRPDGVLMRRIDFNWWTSQGANYTGAAGKNDSVDWSNINAILDAAYDGGYQLIGMIAYPPPWAGGNGSDGHNYPTHYEDYANFCYLVAAHCESRHPGVLVIEIWNEPNLGFLQPTSVVNYTKLLVAAYDAVHSGAVAGRANRTAYPQVQVITGGTAPASDGPNRSRNWSQYIITNAPNKFDHISIHPYIVSCPANKDVSWNPWKYDIPQIHASLVAAGRQDAQIICTEVGYFLRADGTPTNTGDTNNCGNFGTGTDGAHEVTITTAATVLFPTLINAWRSAIVNYNVGPLLYFQQDHGHPTDWTNHGGLYGYSTSHNAAANVDSHGDPVMLDAFVAALGSPTDTTPPTIEFVSPLDGDTTDGTTFYVFVQTSDDVSADSAIDVHLKAGNTSFGEMAKIAGYGSFNQGAIPTMSVGAHTLTATATDEAGNSSSTTINFTVADASGVRVDSISPSSGSHAGGNVVTVTGSGFNDATKVRVGGESSTFSIVSDTRIHVTMPAAPRGIARIKVLSGSGISAGSDACKYTYT